MGAWWAKVPRIARGCPKPELSLWVSGSGAGFFLPSQHRVTFKKYLTEGHRVEEAGESILPHTL